MKIDVTTKFDFKQEVWTHGYKYDSNEEQPIKCTVFMVDIHAHSVANGRPLPIISYRLMPVDGLTDTLNWDCAEHRPVSTDFPQSYLEEEVFSTPEEAQEWIDTALPF